MTDTADKQLFNLESMKKVGWARIEWLIHFYARQSDCYYRRKRDEPLRTSERHSR